MNVLELVRGSLRQRSVTLRAVAAGALLILVAWTWSIYGPHIVDDAYITLRYARNMAEGKGLVYNPGERVQGSSTPLFSVLLGVLGVLGLDIPTAALGIGLMAGLATLGLLILGGRLLGQEEVGWLAAFALSTHLVWILLLVSGMETALYSVVILGALLAIARERWAWVGPLIGLACLVRYDGAILVVAALTVTVWKGGWKTALREAIKAGAVYLPWFLFAWVYFGTPVPQSIRAKLLINCLSWGAILEQYRYYLTLMPLMCVWLPLAGLGMVLAIRRNAAWLVVPLWSGLFLAAFFVKRRPVAFYPWYLVPLFPPLFLMAAWGLSEALRRAMALCGKVEWRRRVLLWVGILLVVLQGTDLLKQQSEYGAGTFHKERKYQQVAAVLAETIQPGESVYVGEVGTLGWFLPEAHIIDSAALLSPRVYEIRRRDRENLLREGKHLEDFPDGSPAVTRMVIEELQPDYITTARFFLFIEEIRNEPTFQRQYEEIESSRLATLDQCAFRRRRSGRE